MSDTSSPRPESFRIGSLRNFLPLSEDVVTTRGQRLPSIIRERSTASIADFRSPRVHRRHSSFLVDSDDENDLERDGERAAKGRGGEDASEAQGKMSNGSQVSMTPQMRSMRLIGNNNPRYQWYIFCCAGA